MSTIPRQEVLTYAAMMERVQKEAARKAVAAVKSWLAKNPDWEAADLREFCIALVDSIVDEYGAAMSSLACDLYDGTMGGDFAPAQPWSGNFRDAIRRAVRYQLQKALDGDTDGFLKAIEDMTAYYTRGHANETTMENCERDSRAYAPGGLSDDETLHQPIPRFAPSGRNALPVRNPRRRYPGGALQPGDPAFARVPTGAETCSYCMMLASRGFAYRSRESAGHADHRGCNCLIIAGRHGDAVEGVDTSAQYKCWRKLESLEAKAAQNPEEFGETPGEQKAEIERRKQAIVDSYGDSIMVSTEPGEVRKAFGGKPRQWYEPRSRMAANYTP